jgi:hypothetical protein
MTLLIKTTSRKVTMSDLTARDRGKVNMIMPTALSS